MNAAGTADESPKTPMARRIRGPILWASIGVALLACSGIVRGMQDRRFEQEQGYLEDCPFSLASIPNTLGGWKVMGGEEKGLDALTLRITGSTDHILRTYVDELTGVTLSALVLFGPAVPVVPHTPEVCYPACGFVPVDESMTRPIKIDKKGTAPFRSAVYAKSGGRTILREEVYYSFRLGNDWSPDMGRGRKFPRKNPGIFKVQVQRRVVEGERRDRDEPIEQFLGLLVDDIERRVANAATDAAKSKLAAVGTVTAR